MKVKVKTLRGIQFEVEAKLEDTVADLKKNIESVEGADVYPAARQMLIYRSKVLKDDTTLQENEVVDSDFIVIILSPPTNPDIPSDDPNGQEASRLAEGISLLAGVIDRIVEEGGGRWDTETAVRALYDALNNPEFVEELNSVIPESPADPPTGTNANPLNLFPQDLPAGADGNLDHMSQGELLDGFRKAARAASPELFPITREENAALERLEAMGFSRLLVWQAYLECNKNEELAANYLLEQRPDSKK